MFCFRKQENWNEHHRIINDFICEIEMLDMNNEDKINLNTENL